MAKTKEEALILANSIQVGKPLPGCPIAFSYVGACHWLAEYVLECAKSDADAYACGNCGRQLSYAEHVRTPARCSYCVELRGISE